MSDEPKLPLILKVEPKPNFKKLFLKLSTCDDELLSTSKIVTFLAVPLPKLYQSPSNAIPQPLYTHLLLSLFFTILVAPNKQYFNVKVLSGIFGQVAK